jgi:S1-C subfamily serine protease
MRPTTEGSAEPEPTEPDTERRERWRGLHARVRGRLKPVFPFVLGVAAALIGLFLYNVLFPPPQPLTTKQVSTAVAEAMASATPPPAFSAQIYRVIQPSLVLIETSSGSNNGTGNGVTGASLVAGSYGLGSGVVISDQGEILTALHVVSGAARIKVTFADGTQAQAKVMAAQPQNDIAVLQPDKLPEVLVPAVMGNPGAMQVGDEAYAFGNPFGLYGSLSTGVVSGLHRSFQPTGSSQSIDDLIQIDSAVNPGNSGGPLLNRYGQVIGIVVALLNPTDQDFFVGIGFAVPITTAAGAAGAPQY